MKKKHEDTFRSRYKTEVPNVGETMLVTLSEEDIGAGSCFFPRMWDRFEYLGANLVVSVDNINVAVPSAPVLTLEVLVADANVTAIDHNMVFHLRTRAFHY